MNGKSVKRMIAKGNYLKIHLEWQGMVHFVGNQNGQRGLQNKVERYPHVKKFDTAGIVQMKKTIVIRKSSVKRRRSSCKKMKHLAHPKILVRSFQRPPFCGRIGTTD